MIIGDSYKTHMSGSYQVGDKVLLINGWFRVDAVENGSFMDYKLYTLIKVRDAHSSEYKPAPEIGSSRGSNDHLA